MHNAYCIVYNVASLQQLQLLLHKKKMANNEYSLPI